MSETQPVPWVLFALGREALEVRRRWRRIAPVPGPGRAWLGERAGLQVLFAETGIGAHAALATLRGLLQRGNIPSLLVSAGFAGGLEPGLQVGAVLRAREVADENGNVWPCVTGGEVASGRVLTVNRLVNTPAQKRELGQRHGAQVVDMESAALARACSRHGLPFGCVRAISDDVNTSLPADLARCIPGGRPRLAALLALLLRQPGRVGSLCRLARDSRRAARALAGTLEDLLRTEPPPPAPGSAPRSGFAR